MKRPNFFLYIFLGFLLRIFAFFKGQRIRKHVKIDKPAIILSNHTSFYDFVYTTTAVYPKRVNYLAASKMFYDPLLGFFLRLARAIPKCLFQTDPVATLKALKILKKNGIVGILPEGQISPIGVTLEYNPAIVKLIKKAKVSVYSVRHMGAYLVNPPWTKKSYAGRIETDIDLIVSSDEIMNLSEIEIEKRINDRLVFNTHEYNEHKKMRVKLKDIDNLESIIYHCPVCANDHLESRNTKLFCPDCKSEFIYDAFGKVGGYRLDKLYREQERLIAKKIEDDPNFSMSAEVRLEGYRNNRVKDIGNGKLTLGVLGYDFVGVEDGNPVQYHFNPQNILSLPSDLGINIQIYDNYKLYQFVFSEKRIPTQFVIAGEYFYKFLRSKNA